MYYELVQIADNQDFIDAAKSMGWDETNYNEILDALKEEGAQQGFIVNYDSTKKRVSGEFVDEVTLYFTIGAECQGNSWFPTELSACRTKDGKMWASETVVDESCC